MGRVWRGALSLALAIGAGGWTSDQAAARHDGQSAFVPGAPPDDEDPQPDVVRVTDGAPTGGTPLLPADDATVAVAPEVRSTLQTDDAVPVIIRLRDQANLSTVSQRARAAERRGGAEAQVTTVVDALRETADATQDDVAGLLEAERAAGRASDIRSFWVFNGFAATLTQRALDRLAGHPDIESITLDEEITLPEPAAATTPRLPTWSLEKINAPDVWGEHGFTGEGVVVGIMDSGVDGGHPALASRYRGRDGDHEHSWYAATGENYPTPGDGHGHGTHVMGSIVGGPPGQVTGVAPDAEWIAVKIFRDSGSTTTSIIHDGFQWMLAPGGDPAAAPDVVNNSWGSAATNNPEFWDDVNAWVAAGIFPAFANGNDGPAPGTVGSPGSFPQSFGVGATDIDDLIAAFSSRGPVVWDGIQHIKPQVSAPGVDVFSTWPRQLDADGYNTISGTSMATPHVTGVVALLLSAEPDLTVDAVRDLLVSTARDEPHMGSLPNNDYGTGVVDAEAAITASSFSGTVTGTVRGPDGPIAARVAVPALGIATTSDPVTGFYELRVERGTWDVEVGAYGYVAETAELTIAPDDVVALDFTLAAAAVHTVTGTVTSGGAPVADAAVRVHDTPLATIFTDAGGTFSVDVAAGTYEVSAEATGYERRTQTVTVEGDEELAFDLERLDAPVAPGWAEYQNNPTRAGVSGDPLAATALAEAWNVDLPEEALFSSPVVAGGTAYLITADANGAAPGQLNAVDVAAGTVRWTFPSGEFSRGTPAVEDGRLFFGSGDDGVFHALDAATGEPLWSVPTGDRLTYTSPTVVDGTVYFGTGWGTGNGGWVYAVDAASGAVRWKTFVGSQMFWAPAVGGGKVYAASYDAARLVALDAVTGAELWSLSRAGRGDSFAAMPSYAAGILYAATGNFDTGAGSMLAVDATTGALVWEATGHGDGAGSAPVIHGDLVVAGSNSRNWVAAYDRATGARTWVASIGSAVSSAQLGADGTIVGGSQQDHRAWALDAYTGELVWDATLTDNVLGAPAYAAGFLLFSTREGGLHAYIAPGTVTGTVTDAEGEPLAATVRLDGTATATRTDPATGAYELAAPAGRYTVEASAYGYRPASAEVTIRSGRASAADFTLERGALGAVTGTVTDAAGSPLAGVTVALTETPLEPVVTRADGAFAFDVVEGGYTLTAGLPGYVPFETPVTVTAGATTEVEVELLRYQIAVTGDYQGLITGFLAGRGHRVESTTAAAIADRAGDYELIVMNAAQDDPGEGPFEQLLAGADAAETSVVFLDTWGISYGSVRQLSLYTGDPVEVGSGFSDGVVSLISRADHPLTAALTEGQRVPLLGNGFEYAFYTGYSGRTLADVHLGELGVVGGGIGLAPRSLGSAHVLLPALAGSPWTGPTEGWQPAAGRVLEDAVEYALDAEFARVAGSITDAAGGAPLPATVTVAETGETVTAGADGSYRLLLEPGTWTVRLERIGYTPVERTVTVAGRDDVTLDVQLEASGLGAISGTVTADGAPLGGATVEVGAIGLTATTAADGRYTVNNVPGGTYDVSVTATGFITHTAPDVAVTDGQVTTLDVVMRRQLRVAVIGDEADVVDNEISTFLDAHEVLATPTGWEAIDDLDAYDVVIVHNPTDPGETAFRAALDALDAAGKSAIFIEGALSADGGVRLLGKYLGNPTGRDFVSRDGDPQYRAVDPAHPLFDGLTSPVHVLNADEWGGFFTGYTGAKLADFATNELGVVGVGAGYEPRTPTSVRLLLSGLSSSIVASPSRGWSQEGGRLFLNAVRWAASPGLAGISGRVQNAAAEPIAGATATVVETGIHGTTGPDGTFRIGHQPGEFTLEISAFGYGTARVPVTLTANQTTDVPVTLALAAVGHVAGVVTSRPDVGTGERPAEEGRPIEGATVELVGFPRRAVTADDGSYTLANVEPGTYQLVVSAPGHVRQTVDDVVVTTGATTTADAALRPSPRVGVIGECTQNTGCTGKAKGYLRELGYVAEDLAWTDTGRVGEFDLVLANLGNFPRVDPGAAGLAAFRDAADRAHVPVIWLDTFQRGAIRYLTDYEGDPAVRVEDRTEGVVSAQVLVDHPLVAGFEAGQLVPVMGSDGEFAFFDQYSGTTVANIVTEDGGVRGGGIAYRGRTASSVDVLLSAHSINFNGWPPVGDQPAELWTAPAERLFQNALAWALDAPPLAAEARGTVVTSATGRPIASTVTVAETGKTYQGRDGDGTFLVPLQPGTWTLTVSAFGHDDVTRSVTVAAGDAVQLDITLPADDVGAVAGTVSATAGAPVAGAAVSLEGTPLKTTTAADGTYAIAGVPAGEHTVRVQATGFAVAEIPVTIVAGSTATVDVELEPSRIVAVSGDHQSSISDLLTANGYEVRPWSWPEVDAHIGELGEVGLVVLNALGADPTVDELNAFLDAAAAAQVSVVALGTFNNGAIVELKDARGDPATTGQDFTPTGVNYVPAAAHPIFAGFPAGEPVEILRNAAGGNQQYSWFGGYTGSVLATVAAPDDGGARGDGVGYAFTSPASVEVLLDSLAASNFARPTSGWSPAANTIFLNTVDWALTATQATVAGTVTSGGAPVAGATVTAVEAGRSTTTAADGTYHLGVADGTHTIRVTAAGYEPFETVITVEESGDLTLDVELVRLPRGAIAGSVTDATSGEGVAGAQVALSGPMPGSAVTDSGGGFTFDDLLPGNYTLDVSADRYLPTSATVTVVGGETATPTIELTPNDVGVLGDWESTLTGFLRGHGVAAEELEWETAATEAARFDVVIVNGGEPSDAQFDALVAAADATETSLVFTGTWGVDEGGIRLLEAFGDGEVSVGGQGFGEGAVGITGFDPAHPLFAGIEDPSALLAGDSYFSALDHYVGPYLADLVVEDVAETGVSVAYDFRRAGSVHLLLSAGAVNGLIGPGYGWNDGAERLMLNAIAWAKTVEQAVPAAPTLATEAPACGSAADVTLAGTSEFRSTVSIRRDGEVIATAEPGRDGTFDVDVKLVEGRNVLAAVATNHAGPSAASAAVTLTLDTTGPVLTWEPPEGTGYFASVARVAGTAADACAGVAGITVNGQPVAVAGGGAFAADVPLTDGEQTITVIATDTLGNQTTETRTVRSFDYDTTWEVAGEKGKGTVNVLLHVTDATGARLQVDSVTLDLYDVAGDLARTQPMRWEARDRRYHAQLKGLKRGDYVAVAKLVVETWNVTVEGPTIRKR